MQRFSYRQPLAFSVAVTLTFALGLLAWVFVLPHPVTLSEVETWQLLGMDATRILIPVVFLTVLGWWRTAGFTQRPTWSTLAPFLPLLLFPLFPLFFGPGFKVTDPGEITLLVVTNLAVGFGEEATFRGVVLKSLAPRGLMRAAVLSSVLFGLMHLVNIAAGGNAGNVGFQVAYTMLIGFTFAAVALVAGSIWPLVVIHFAMDFINSMQQSTSATTTQSGVDIVSGLINVGVFAIFAVYGYWLLRRHLNQEPTAIGARARKRMASASGGE